VSLWSATLSEAGEQRTLWFALAVVAISILVHLGARGEQARLRRALVLFILYLVLLPIAAYLRLANHPALPEVRVALFVSEALTLIGLSAILLFGLLLPRARLDVPQILRDVLVASAAVVAFFAIASRSGFNVSGLIATSTVLTAVVGLSLQDTLGNLMAGLALQMDHSVAQGDWITVGDVTGRVTEIRWRSTSLETRNWETLVVPNSVLVKNSFLVLGRREGAPSLWRRTVLFNVDFRFAPNDVIPAVVEEICDGPIEGVAAAPAPNCILLSFHESYARYAVRYWLANLAADDATDSVIRTRIYFALKRAGIPLSIPAHAVFLTEESKEREADKAGEEQRRRMEALARVEFFDQLADADRARLAAGLRDAPFARGEVMTRQGDEAHWLYLILEGEAQVSVRGEGGMERSVARLGRGNLFGEMSLMTGAPRAATVVAITDVECYRLDKAVFKDVLKDRPELAERAAEILARRTLGLEAARHELDEEAKRRHLESAKTDLLDRIRGFFGLADDPPAGRSA
jgi:small-conductance mechanosensitive channel/CRP-like cAMP-binding protein